MAKYTTTIRHLKDNGFDFGLRDYPIFDEEYRTTLNDEILDYYLMYEIGFETPSLFKHYLNVKMKLVMKKYNPLYEIQKDLILKYPLSNVDLTETMDKDTTKTDNTSSNGTVNGTSNSSSSHKNLYQDTPQGQLDKTSMENQTWATNLTLDTDSSNANGTTTSSSTGAENGSGTEDYVKKIVGNNGRKYLVEIYNEYIEEFQNIDQNVINELEELFMGVI